MTSLHTATIILTMKQNSKKKGMGKRERKRKRKKKEKKWVCKAYIVGVQDYQSELRGIRPGELVGNLP